MSFDAPPPDLAPPRAEGCASIRLERRDGRDRLARFGCSGSLRALWPRAGGRREAVLINTAGGLTGGDRFRVALGLGPGVALTATTQAAERVYRAAEGAAPAEVSTQAELGAGARLDWLPQETILFDGAALDRRLEVDMAEDATLLAVEPLVLGREAMGETLRRARLHDRRAVRRGGRLVRLEALRVPGDAAALAGPGAFGGARASASLLYVAPDAEARLDGARAALVGAPACAGASAWDGLLVVRLLATDGRALRAALLPLLAVLRDDPLPRVWTF